MAWITKRTTTTGEVRYLVGWREPGSHKRVHQSFHRAADARRFKVEIEGQLDRGEYVTKAQREIPLAEFITHMLDSSHDLAPSTLAGYRSTLRLYIAPVLGYRPIGDITTRELENFVNGLVAAENGHGRGRTIQAVILLAKTFNHAVASGALLRSPMKAVSQPKRWTKEVDALTADEILILAEKVPARYRAAFLLAGFGAARAGEVGGLRVNDIDFPEGKIHFRRQVRTVAGRAEIAELKTKTSQRTIKPPRAVIEALSEHVAAYGTATDGRLFQGERGGLVSHLTLNKVARQAGGPNFHALRHSAGSLLIDAGADPKQVQEYMGHANVSITLNVYAHKYQGRSDALAVKLDEAIAQAQQGAQVVPLVG